MKKITTLIFFFAALFLLAACKPKVESIEVVSDATEFNQDFALSDLSVQLNYSNKTTERVPLTEGMLSSQDLAKFNQIGSHTIQVSYLGHLTSFAITITGPKGDNGTDGREVTLQVANGYIQWRYTGETTWKNLIAISELKGATGSTGPTGQTGPQGPTGQNGNDGREVLFQVANGLIQWKYEGDSGWTTLLELSSLKGADGITPVITISEDGFWMINGQKTAYKAVADVINPVMCTVTFDLNGGIMPEGAGSSQVIEKGDTIDLPLPTREGYLFKGWYAGNTVNDGQYFNNTPITKDITLQARWEQDYGPLHALFDPLKAKNYTLNIHIEQTNSRDSSVLRWSISGFTKVHEKKEGLNVHEYLSYEIFLGEEVYEEFSFDIYDLYHENNDYYMELAPWDNSLGVNIKGYQGNYVELVNPEKFVKRENGLIYDYPVTEELLEELNLDSEEFDPDNTTITLVLNEKKIILWTSSIRGGEENEMTYEIVIADVGNTVVEIPMDDAIAAAQGMLDDVVDSRNLEIGMDDDIEVFLNQIDQYKFDLSNVDDFSELVDRTIEYCNEMTNFEILVDPVKVEILNTKLYMRFLLESLTVDATAESKMAMEQIYNESLIQIHNCTTVEEVSDFYDTFDAAIHLAYTRDPLLYQLVVLRRQTTDNLYELILAYNNCFPSDHYIEFYTIYENYQNQINRAENEEQILQYAEDAVTAIRLLGYTPDSTLSEAAILQQQYRLDLVFNQNMFVFNLNNLPLYNTYRSFRSEEGSDTLETLWLLINHAIELREMFFEQGKEYVLGILDQQYEFYLSAVDPENVPTVTSKYNKALADIDEAGTLYDLSVIKTDFINQCDGLITNTVILDILYYSKELANYYNYLSQIATEDSREAMFNAFLDYMTLIDSSTTSTEVTEYYYDGVNALNIEYVEDIEKTILLPKKINVKRMMYDITNTFEIYSDSPNRLYAWNLMMVNAGIIDAAANEEALDQIFNDWKAEILSLAIEVDLEAIQSMADGIISDLTDRYDTQNADSPFTEEETAGFEAYITAISDARTVFDLFENNYGCLDYLDYVSLIHLKNAVLSELEQKYEYYSQIISPTSVEQLEALYQDYLTFLDEAKNVSQIATLVNQFTRDCEDLEIDSLKLYKYNLKKNLQNMFDNLKSTATPESILAMEDVVNTYLPLFDACSNYEECDFLYMTASSNLYNEYIPSPEAMKTEAYRDFLLSNMNIFVNFVEDHLIRSADISPLWNVYYVFCDFINEDATIADMRLTFEDWISNMRNFGFECNVYAEGDFRSIALDAMDAEYHKLHKPSAVYTIYQNAVESIEACDNVYDIYVNYIICMDELHTAIINQYYADTLNELNERYEYFCFAIIDEEKPELDALYQKYQSKLAAIQYEDEFGFCINEFENQCLSRFTIAPLKFEMYNAIKILKQQVDEHSITATDDSIVAMQSILDDYSVQICLCPDFEGINSTRDAGISAIDAAYVIDPEKSALWETKMERVKWMRDMEIDLTDYLANPSDINDFSDLNDLYFSLFDDATTVTEVEDIYQQWIQAADAMNFELIDGAIGTYQTLCMDDLQSIYMTISYDMTIFTQYQDYLYRIEIATSIFRVNDEFCRCMEWLESLS